MPDNDIPLTGDSRVDAALLRIRGKFQDLEDAMVVQAHLEKGMTERLKEHAKLISDHHVFIQHHETVMREIDDKVNLMSSREMGREGGPETKI